MRPLTTLEENIAKCVLEFGNKKRWEYSAFLDSKQDLLLSLTTSGNTSEVDIPPIVMRESGKGTQITIHHNHLSQESLSWSDWRGLVYLFDETFAHCGDGTIYWGRVKDKCAVIKIINDADKQRILQTTANNCLTNLLMNQNDISPPIDAGRFEKEIICRAMRLCGYVDYEHQWGQKDDVPLAGDYTDQSIGPLGKEINNLINQAAKCLQAKI
jgi:hypothetical protein